MGERLGIGAPDAKGERPRAHAGCWTKVQYHFPAPAAMLVHCPSPENGFPTLVTMARSAQAILGRSPRPQAPSCGCVHGARTGYRAPRFLQRPIGVNFLMPATL